MATAKKTALSKRRASKTSPASAKKIAKLKAIHSTKMSTKTATQQPQEQHKTRQTTSPKEIFQAGLSALSLPRAESAMADGLSKIADSFGFKKLEDVFDQRVASALDRIGIPSAEELSRLIQKVEELSALIQTKKPKADK
jgi:transposase